MGLVGPELCPNTSRKIESAKTGGALSGAVEADSDGPGHSDDAGDGPAGRHDEGREPESDPDLAAIIASWDRLTPAVRRSLAEMARASAQG